MSDLNDGVPSGAPVPAPRPMPGPPAVGPRPVPGPGPGPVPGPAGPPAATGPTGHPVVDAALEQLERVIDLPAAEQVPAYEAAHRALQQTLASIDQA